MTTTTAVAKNIHLSAQKARLVADQIRGLPVAQALNILNFSPKKGAGIIKKALDSAIANAEHNDGADIDELKVVDAFLKDQGLSQANVDINKFADTQYLKNSGLIK